MIQVIESMSLGFPSLTIRSAFYELTVLPAVGGRIIGFGLDGINLLWQNERLEGHRPSYEASSPEELRSLRASNPILLYGGEKTWLAPQSDWGGTPYVDLDHGEYVCEIVRGEDEQSGSVTLTLTSPVCRETGLQLVRTLSFAEGARYIDIEQRLINRGSVQVTKGLWQVTMLNRNGTAHIPQGPELEAAVPIPLLNGEDADVSHTADGWTMVVDNSLMYKLGFMTDGGRASAVYEADNGKTYALTKTFTVEPGRKYPHGTVVEVYNSSEYPYYELEVHSPAYTLNPGDDAAFTIRWELAGR
ncbi:DUF4380 domain-containing protein [Paenibacillus silvisoli]|uniref:DUF4380 domain-containing protein n=1 Tax=Paenibacillus silvisoli TaxID=3110539 RepID=UPI0028054E0B|nr:DUF4380 domain-containing protein [Paenibacillus silvisoli]